MKDVVSRGKALAAGTDFQVNHSHVGSGFLHVAGTGKGTYVEQQEMRVLSRNSVNV